MRFGFAVLYTALALSANATFAGNDDLMALREGTMKKLIFSDPQTVSELGFTDPKGGEHHLSDFNGKYILLNFWATWCAPCRKEMPMLSELQTEFKGKHFEVVTIATGRNELAGMQRFLKEIEVDNLPLFLDPKQKLAREMGVLGLPITVILNPQGQEIARMRGGADWNSESAKAIIAALIAKIADEGSGS